MTSFFPVYFVTTKNTHKITQFLPLLLGEGHDISWYDSVTWHEEDGATPTGMPSLFLSPLTRRRRCSIVCCLFSPLIEELWTWAWFCGWGSCCAELRLAVNRMVTLRSATNLNSNLSTPRPHHKHCNKCIDDAPRKLFLLTAHQRNIGRFLGKCGKIHYSLHSHDW